MPLNLVDLGTAGVPNSGDTIRDGGEKINANFEYLDTRVDSIETNVESSLEDAQAAATAAEEAALEAQEAAALANAYQGSWSSATGAATKGSSYEYNGIVWMLLVDVPDITATTPSTSNSDWIVAGGGTAAAYDVTESTTDTSLGGNGQPRVMRVGDFGVGQTSTLSSITQAQLDDYAFGANNSSYRVISPSGLPAGTYLLQTYKSVGANNVFQLLMTMNVSTKMYSRMLNQSEPTSSWQEILHTGNTGSIVTEDYEEGTWTPSAGSFTTVSGVYTKIGNIVNIRVLINGAGSASSITGLPFTPDSAYSGQLSIGFASYCTISNSNGSPFVFRVKTVPSEIGVFEIEGTGASATITGSSSITRISLEGSYRIA